jgi:hypothetical protein
LALSHLSAIENPDTLRGYFQQLPDEALYRLCDAVHVRRTKPKAYADTDAMDDAYSKELLIDALVYRYRKRVSQLDTINQTSLYPDEVCIFPLLDMFAKLTNIN